MAAFTRWQGGRQHCAANVRCRFSALQRITQGCCFNCLCRDCCCRGCCASWCLAHPVTGFIMGIPCIFSPCCSFPTSSPHSFPFLLSSLFPHWSPLHCHVSSTVNLSPTLLFPFHSHLLSLCGTDVST